MSSSATPAPWPEPYLYTLLRTHAPYAPIRRVVEALRAQLWPSPSPSSSPSPISPSASSTATEKETQQKQSSWQAEERQARRAFRSAWAAHVLQHPAAGQAPGEGAGAGEGEGQETATAASFVRLLLAGGVRNAQQCLESISGPFRSAPPPALQSPSGGAHAQQFSSRSSGTAKPKPSAQTSSSGAGSAAAAAAPTSTSPQEAAELAKLRSRRRWYVASTVGALLGFVLASGLVSIEFVDDAALGEADELEEEEDELEEVLREEGGLVDGEEGAAEGEFEVEEGLEEGDEAQLADDGAEEEEDDDDDDFIPADQQDDGDDNDDDGFVEDDGFVDDLHDDDDDDY